MQKQKTKQVKTRLHPRNVNRTPYDLDALIGKVPDLANYLKLNKHGNQSIDFAAPEAVKLLNKALLHHYYTIPFWDFPQENLCPPIPGRADYIHYIADLLAENNYGTIPAGNKIVGLDIGVGASCIYPILGVSSYSWQFIASDIDKNSLASADNIIQKNDLLKDKVSLRHQKDKDLIFRGILQKEDKIDFTMCNPPFHSSETEAQKSTQRKVRNLSGNKAKNIKRNFAGQHNELIYEGGEHAFIHKLIAESKLFAHDCFWFTTLVSKKTTLKGMYKALELLDAIQVKTIALGTGNKTSRIVAWTFLSKEEQKEWRKK